MNTKSSSNPDPNLSVYDTPAVAEHYAGLSYLTPCEQLLFDASLKPGSVILDLGVGGGRTTPYLSGIAAHYVGLDYAREMIEACRNKFPDLKFELGDAADLSRFPSSTFDAVVMAFNGMDYVIPDARRFRALEEIGRVLKPDGILIFSSHNPRAIFARVSWNRQRVREWATNIVSNESIFFQPLLWFLTALRALVGAAVAMCQSIARILRRLPAPAFWRGQGYWKDPAHGGLQTHGATPENVVREVEGFGFQVVRVLGDDYPKLSRKYFTDWYYYVFAKAGRGEK